MTGPVYDNEPVPPEMFRNVWSDDEPAAEAEAPAAAPLEAAAPRAPRHMREYRNTWTDIACRQCGAATAGDLAAAGTDRLGS